MPTWNQVWQGETSCPTKASPFNDLDQEDNGCALILHVSDDDDTEDGMFVKVQSWAEDPDLKTAHAEMHRLFGKRVRVTVEVLE
jgi:hypothetical protein